MSLLSDLKTIINTLNIPVETGVFSGEAPSEYIVLVPIYDNFELYADDFPEQDVQSVRISLFTKNNYSRSKKALLKAILAAGVSVTSRQYIGFETDTKYHHYNIDVENLYNTEDLK